jgi:hypothetical protein
VPFVVKAFKTLTTKDTRVQKGTTQQFDLSALMNIVNPESHCTKKAPAKRELFVEQIFLKI